MALEFLDIVIAQNRDTFCFAHLHNAPTTAFSTKVKVINLETQKLERGIT